MPGDSPLAPAKKRQKMTVSETSSAGESNTIQSSPYVGTTVMIKCGDPGLYYVPQGVLRKYPKLSIVGGYLELLHLGHREAHTIVHFLYSGTYQCLESTKTEEKEKSREALSNSFKVYAFATSYEIGHLAGLALDDIQKRGDSLGFDEIIRVLDELDFKLDDTQGSLADYMDGRAKMAGETITEAQVAKLRDEIGGHRTISNILLENMVDMRLTIQKYQNKYGPLP
ncbi:hypothetical protein F66182_7851 [Fusarium sp. NRRL 66182]|nr:hypothetical protein F66182_7851 [Fusarium sp. NRRL 66182]